MASNNMTLPKVTHLEDRSSLDAVSVSEEEMIERGVTWGNTKISIFRLWQTRGSICKTIHKLQALIRRKDLFQSLE